MILPRDEAVPGGAGKGRPTAGDGWRARAVSWAAAAGAIGLTAGARLATVYRPALAWPALAALVILLPAALALVLLRNTRPPAAGEKQARPSPRKR